MNTYSNFPAGAQKAVFSISEGFTGTWWNPLLRSSLERYCALPKRSIISSTLGIRYESGTETALIRLKSTQRRTDPPFFLTGIMGDDQGLREGRMMPVASRSCISAGSWSFHAGARRYGAVLKGGELEVFIHMFHQ